MNMASCQDMMCKKIPERDTALGVVDSSHDSLSVPSWTFPGLTSEEPFQSRSVILSALRAFELSYMVYHLLFFGF